ncbi:SDR family NAD(P)-dependent oxidoreductase, partial [Alistipes putredinis]
CDLLLHCAGIGYNNPQLDAAREIATAETNTVGFTRIMDTAFDYFRRQGGGHLAAISSIAGTKGLGAAAAYSASKRYQNTYLDALAQLSRMQRLDIRITDIRPGFVDTPLLREGKYPMLMRPEKVAARIVRALEQRKRRIVIDRRYTVLVFFWRLIPEWLWERLPIRTK